MSEFSQAAEVIDLNGSWASTVANNDNSIVASRNTLDVSARFLQSPQSGLRSVWLDNEPAPVEMTAARQWSLAAKRLVDIAGASIGLLFLSPLLLFCAALIVITDKGPVLFRQQRVGLDGKSFNIFKFRSMYVADCDASGIRQTTATDNRVTPIGRFLRKTSIDELPQLLNVLRGDMSIVGPRPHVAGMLAAGVPYEELSPHYGYRHNMRPGITGWAQCNSLRGSTVEERHAFGRLGHDIAYVQNFSLLLDIKIILMTLRQEFLRGAAY